MRVCLTILIALVLAVEVLPAGELHGVVFPDTLEIGETSLELNGMGTRKKLWVKVYVAGLYLETASSDPDTILSSSGAWRIVMHFLHKKVGVDKLNSAWEEGFRKNAPTTLENHSEEIEKFLSYFQDVHKGEEILITFLPGKGLEVDIAGESKGTIVPASFAKAVLSIWLGPEPPSGDLKKGLLGLED